jgi:hypothetical protein
MSDIDFTVFSIPMLLSRNKSGAYQEQILSRYTVLMRFLKDNNLVLKEPFDDGGALKKDLVVKRSEVDARCLELYKKAIPGWHAYLDKGGDVNNTDRLIKALAKLP